MSLWKKIKSGWMKFALALGRVNTAILLSIVYILVLGPTSVIGRLFRAKFLGERKKKEASYAVPLTRVTSTMERAHKQF
jgi:hypothetical protein